MPATRPALCALLSALVVVPLATPADAAEGARPGRTPMTVSATDPQDLERVGAAAGTRLVVRVQSGAQLDAVGELARAQGATVRQELPSLRALSVSTSPERAAEVAAALREAPQVTSVRRAASRTTSRVPDDPSWAQAQGYLRAIRADEAWDVTTGAPAVRIAVVDTGVDVSHPDLAGRVVGRFNAADGSQDVTDADGHGTFVAGVAAAVGSNGLGVTGIAHDASLLAVKVSDDGLFYTDELAAGITWAADNGADVMNLSYGGEETDALEQSAIAYAQSKGVLVVAAAGNGATQVRTYPAALPDVVAVGATDLATGRAADFSNTGDWVDVGAPGTGIVSLAPGGGVDSGDGTSFASPLVAGQAALLLSSAPSLTAAQVGEVIAAGARGLADQGLGSGQVDLRGSLDLLRPATVPALTAPAAGAPAAGVVPLRATSSAPTVAFSVDGVEVGRAPVTAGTAALDWPSWGLPGGAHELRATDCAAYGCGTPGAPVTVDLGNPAPVVSSPAAGATVDGEVVVLASASDAAPVLRLAVDGVAVDSAPSTAGGEVRLRWLSTGAAPGPHVLAVQTCTAEPACAAGSSVPVVVANPAPVLTAPSAGSVVTGTTTLTATGPVGGMLLRRGETVLGFDATAPYAVTTDFSSVQDGTYALSAQSCQGTAATCTGARSEPVVVTNRSLHPRLSVSPAQVSPNGDGRSDRTTARLVLDRAAALSWSVLDATGRTVRAPAGLGSRAAGTHAITWDGRGSGGARLADGTYAVVVSASADGLRGSARAAVRVDTTAPGLIVTAQAGGVYPVADGFRDALAAPARLAEAATLTLTVRSSRGSVVRVLSGSRGAGTTSLSWNGRDSRGRTVPSGTYSYQYTAQDAAGNRRSSARYGTAVSGRRLVGTARTRTLTPAESMAFPIVGECSALSENDWPGGLDLLSGYHWDGEEAGLEECFSADADVAASAHSTVLPAAVAYGGIRLSITGRAADSTSPDDSALAWYSTPAEALVSETALPGAYGTRALPVVPASLLTGGRELRWVVGTTGYSWWSIRSFTVSWTSYALV